MTHTAPPSVSSGYPDYCRLYSRQPDLYQDLRDGNRGRKDEHSYHRPRKIRNLSINKNIYYLTNHKHLSYNYQKSYNVSLTTVPCRRNIPINRNTQFTCYSLYSSFRDWDYASTWAGRAMKFEGNKVTQFLKDWDFECAEYGYSEAQKCKKLPRYCSKEIGERQENYFVTFRP